MTLETVREPETLQLHDYRTPRGGSALMEWRVGTNDHNTLFSCMTEDEYRLAELTFGPDAVAVDVGAYIGGVTVSLARDNGGLRVIAVEPVTANVALLQDNLARNNLADQVLVLHAAAGRPGQTKARVLWAFGDDEAGRHHRYVGNSSIAAHQAIHEEEDVEAIDLEGLVALAGGHVDFMKVDCEGGEYALFAGGAEGVGHIVGEYHDGAQRLVDLLDATHVVTIQGTDHFGAFRADPR